MSSVNSDSGTYLLPFWNDSFFLSDCCGKSRHLYFIPDVRGNGPSEVKMRCSRPRDRACEFFPLKHVSSLEWLISARTWGLTVEAGCH